jgi:long-chain acyl-CoA synthetase
VSLPTWILPLARIFIKLRVDGLEHLGDLPGPVIFAANHQSHMDTPAILIALPARWRYRVSPAMAKEFFDAHFHPERFPRRRRYTRRLLYYLACQFFNAFPLPQREAGTRETLRYMGAVLADEYSILIFPEGRRNAGEAVGEFKPGVGMMAAKLGVPIVPVRIEGLDAVLHPKMRWPQRGPVRIAFGAPLAPTGADFAALAAQVQQAVARL